MTDNSKNDSDTPFIDEKKNITSKDAGTFSTMAIEYLKNLLYLIFYILIGTLVLYSSKVFQSGIIPTNTDFAPYTKDNFNNNVKTHPVDINIVKTKDAVYSTKIEFPYKKNIEMLNNNGILSFLGSLKSSPKSTHFKLYFATIFETIISMNLSLFEKFYSILGYLWEWIVIFIVPYFMTYFYLFLIIMNSILLFVFNFYYIYLFFSTKETANGKTIWKDHDISYFWYFCYFIIVLLCSMFGFAFISIIGLIITIYAIVLPLFMTGNILGKSKLYSLKNVFSDVLKYKKQVIMFFASFYLFTTSYSSFGTQGLVWSILACIIVYIFFPSVYKQYIPKSTDYASVGLVQSEIKGGDNVEDAVENQGLDEGVNQGIDEDVKQDVEQGVDEGVNQYVKQDVEQGINQDVNQGLQQPDNKSIANEEYAKVYGNVNNNIPYRQLVGGGKKSTTKTKTKNNK